MNGSSSNPSILGRASRTTTAAGIAAADATALHLLRQKLVPRLNPQHSTQAIYQRFVQQDGNRNGQISYQSFINVCNKELKLSIASDDLRRVVDLFPGGLKRPTSQPQNRQQSSPQHYGSKTKTINYILRI